MNQPCIITVAITGSLPRKQDNPAVPISVAEQIESTQEAFEAGASLVHIHVRNDDQSSSSDPERFAERCSTVSFRLAKGTHTDAATFLGDRGIFTWDGNFYALNLTECLGVEQHGGVLRVGLVHYNTADEVNRQRGRHAEFRERVDALFRSFDFLILPCSPISKLEAGKDHTETRSKILRYTTPLSLAGTPVVTVPFPKGAGIQLAASRGEDARLIGFAAALAASQT